MGEDLRKYRMAVKEIVSKAFNHSHRQTPSGDLAYVYGTIIGELSKVTKFDSSTIPGKSPILSIIYFIQEHRQSHLIRRNKKQMDMTNSVQASLSVSKHDPTHLMEAAYQEYHQLVNNWKDGSGKNVRENMLNEYFDDAVIFASVSTEAKRYTVREIRSHRYTYS